MCVRMYVGLVHVGIGIVMVWALLRMDRGC